MTPVRWRVVERELGIRVDRRRRFHRRVSDGTFWCDVGGGDFVAAEMFEVQVSLLRP